MDSEGARALLTDSTETPGHSASRSSRSWLRRGGALPLTSLTVAHYARSSSLRPQSGPGASPGSEAPRLRLAGGGLFEIRL